MTDDQKRIAELEALLKKQAEELNKIQTPAKGRVSNKKQIEDYLFLYEILLHILKVESWTSLQSLLVRDEYGKIHLNLQYGVNILTLYELKESVEEVNRYEHELKRRYKSNFEYTDYQVFSILFSELFLNYKEQLLAYMKEHIPNSLKEIYLVSDDFDFSDQREVARVCGGLTGKGTIKQSFKIEVSRRNIVTESQYFKNVNKLAYYMATGSGKTVILHTNILQAKKHFKKVNCYVVVPTKELGKQHKKNLIVFGYSEDDIGFIDVDKSDNISQKVNSMLLIPYAIKIITVHQLSAITKRNTIFSGQNILFVDEGHKGQKSDASWREDRVKLMGEDGFSFEYSATFSQAIKDEIGLLQTYSKAIVFDYPYHKFYNDGYGKKPKFEPQESIDSIYKKINNKKEKLIEIEDDERYELFVQDLLDFYLQKRDYHKLSKREKEKFRFENPLKLIICSTVDDKNNKSKVVEVLDFLKRFSTKTDEAFEIIDKKKVKFQLKEKSESIYNKMFFYLFNSNKSGKIVEYRLNEKELGLKVEEAEEYFGVVNVGNISHLGRNVISDKLTNTLINDFFIKGDNPKVNMVIAARILIEGWDTQRISSLSLFDFGKSKGSLIVQLFGRGVRLHGSVDNNLKRSHVHEKLEEFIVYGYDAEYLKTFIEESELESIIRHKSITIKHSGVSSEQLENLRVLTSRSNFSEELLVYNFDMNDFNRLFKKLPYKWVEEEANGFEVSLKNFVSLELLYEDVVACQKENIQIPLGEFNETVSNILDKNIRIKKSLKTDGFEMFYRIALKVVNAYFEHWYKEQLKSFEFQNVEYKKLDKQSKNIDFEYKVTADENTIEELKNELLREKDNGFYKVEILNILNHFRTKPFSIKSEKHLYNPLLIKHDELQISPDRLEESELDFLKALRKYQDGENITLLRNQIEVGFNGFYPDFIMWYRKDEIEHFIFIDPKGINNFNVSDIWNKLAFSLEIKNIEKKLRKKGEENLRLHSFILTTKSLNELVNNDVIKDVLNNKITKSFTSNITELDGNKIKEALRILNLLWVKDDKLIEKILEEIEKDDVEQIKMFVKEHLIKESDVQKLENFMKANDGVYEECTFIQTKEEAIYAYFYKEILKDIEAFERFCKSLETNELSELIKEMKEKGAEEIITELGLELLLDVVPFIRTGKKVADILIKKL